MSHVLPTDTAPLILLVEDEALVRSILAEFLQDVGFAVIEASNADDACTLLNAVNDVALVISDVNMPGSMDGSALARWIDSRFDSMPVILVSGRCSATLASQRQRFLLKPYDLPKLERLIRHLLSSEPEAGTYRH